MSISKKTRFIIFDRDKFTCRYCGRNSEEVTLEVDHIIARSKGGSDDHSNLVTACFDCNRGKSAMDLLSAPPVDYLRMAQEIREQQMAAEAIRQRDIEEEVDRHIFIADVYEILGHDYSYVFHPQTMAIIFSYTKEFGCAEVLRWVKKAAEVTDGRDISVGRYVSGIRRKIKEEAV